MRGGVAGSFVDNALSRKLQVGKMTGLFRSLLLFTSVIGLTFGPSASMEASNRPPECSQAFLRMWDADRQTALKHLPRSPCLMQGEHDVYVCNQSGCTAAVQDSHESSSTPKSRFPDCSQKFLAAWLWDRETALTHLPSKACILYGENSRYVCDRSGCRADN